MNRHRSAKCRLQEYLIGIIFGYLMYNMKVRTKNSILSLLVFYFGWTLSLGFMYLHVLDRIMPHLPATIDEQAYHETVRSLWSLSVCWIVFTCHHHRTGGIIRWFLSLNMWQPLSKISLCIYLVHEPYLTATKRLSLKSSTSYGSWGNLHINIGDFFFSTIFGAMLYLVVEAPSSRILGIIFTKKSDVNPRLNNHQCHERGKNDQKEDRTLLLPIFQ
jgi:peptidoglycan/LPS O-acetylase OafA/YrhL